MGEAPRWLQRVREDHGKDIPDDEASLLYRPALKWEEHHALCESGDVTALLTLIEAEDHPVEREVLYVTTINMTHSKHPEVAIAIGTRYIEEYYRTPEPFGPGHPPNGAILKRLALLFDPAQYEENQDYTGDLSCAIWVCEFALASGVTDDGTKGGFKRRLEILQSQKPAAP